MEATVDFKTVCVLARTSSRLFLPVGDTVFGAVYRSLPVRCPENSHIRLTPRNETEEPYDRAISARVAFRATRRG